ncbi:RNA polymerase sigma factor [Flavivirga sp. 57AJ16]|uniref:RNA polymerase sigma factor n=1 Tax=Flavivirga sp. 57AJ16 TaxID=3025307 RepID=UPI002365190D|nr:RNA polymerase sigma-70 factor [Flavivirga sp. 57AJ16]MDD7888024.1 RNA polymerase sigma-70 factor [Flavivirga sp. 57AJ16]
MNKEDKKLLEELKSGRESAFESIYNIYYKGLVVYCYNLCKRQDLAEDIVQNVLINIWTKRSDLKISSSFKNYLFRAVHNTFISEYRKQKIEIDINDVKYQFIGDTYMQSDDLTEQRISIVSQAIDRLPKKCRTVFLMSKIKGLKHKDIAKRLNISEKTVEKHISKGLATIKKYVYNNSHLIKIITFYKIKTA